VAVAVAVGEALGVGVLVAVAVAVAVGEGRLVGSDVDVAKGIDVLGAFTVVLAVRAVGVWCVAEGVGAAFEQAVKNNAMANRKRFIAGLTKTPAQEFPSLLRPPALPRPQAPPAPSKERASVRVPE
jgi:hypothetical protein